MRQGSNPRRSRGRGPRKPHAGGKQTFDSNGPDIRVRGSAYQVLEKYLAMARDATSAGDRIAAENYLQHAEHYHRILNTNTGEQQGANGRSRGNGRSEANGFGRNDDRNDDDRNDDDQGDDDQGDEDRNDDKRNEGDRSSQGRSSQGQSSQGQSGEERSEEPGEPGPSRRRSARRAPPQSARQSAGEETAAAQGADEPTEGIV